MRNEPIKIILHHDGVSRSGPSFDIVNHFHQSKEFPLSSLGFYVGYHYWIEKDGSTRQARADEDIGAHTVGQNNISIGIGLAGNFDVEQPTNEQISSLGKLLSELVTFHKIEKDHIYPHRKFAEKTCFGSKLPDNWGVLVLESYLSTKHQTSIDEIKKILCN